MGRANVGATLRPGFPDASGGLVQTHSWDDPDQVIAALSPANQRIFCIESAGDVAFALLIAGAREVVAVCPDFPQFALCELKKTALQLLPVQSVRSFLGLGYFGRRVWFYHYVREALAPDVRRFWDARESLIREGLLGAGLVERRIARVRKLAERILGARAMDRAAHQAGPLLAGRAERLLARGMLARLVAGPVGDRLYAGFCNQPMQGNYLAEWAFTGQYGSLLPAYLTHEGHAALKRGGLVFVTGTPAQMLAQHATFDGGYTGYFPPEDLFCFAPRLCWAELDHTHSFPTDWQELPNPGVGKAFFQKSLRVIEKARR